MFFSLELSAQEYFFNVETINVEQGLPNRRTYKVVQDLDGFIWVSTPGKISRYDGYNFKNYTSDLLNINESLPTFLAVDDVGFIWYCEYPSYSAINETGVIDTKTNEVQNIETFSKGIIKQNEISKISPSDASNAILIETKNGALYSYEAGVFSLVYQFELSFKPKLPCVFREFDKGIYWFGKASNLYQIKNKKIIKQFETPGDLFEFQQIKDTYVAKVINEVSKKNWKLEGDKVVPFDKDELAEPNLIHIQNTFDNYYFLCSDKIIFKNEANEIVYEYDDLSEILNSSSNQLKMHEVFIDRQNIHWVTTEDGLIKIVVQKNNFQVLEKNNSIRGIYKTDKDKLWVGGYFNNIVDGESSNLSEIIPYDNIAFLGFTKDEAGNLWIGTTADLLLKYNLKDQIFEAFSVESNALFLPYYNSDSKKILIGQESGILEFDLKTEQFSRKKLPLENSIIEVRQFLEKGDNIWITSSKGLFLMNKKNGEIIDFFNKEDGFPFDNFNHLHIDKAGVFWIGSRGNGLIRWNRKNNNKKVFSRANGLSNNNIYAVYEDDYNVLWLSTDYGLNRFDKISFETRIFLPKDGIAHEEFNTFSHYRDIDGQLYFGGLSGVTTFHPKDFIKTEFYPKLKIINIEMSEKDVPFSESILNVYNENKALHLNHGHQNLTFNLSLLDYSNPQKNQYAYKFEGGNSQWIYSESSVISLGNLSPGQYNLLLKAKSVSGNRPDEMLSVPILVEPPFYRQLWFIVLMVSIGALLIYIGVTWRINKLESDRLQLETEVAKRTETILKQTEELKALDKAKTQFFSNITHEFRTPLTLIIGPLEQLLEAKLEGFTQKKLKGIHRNANLLKNLINQLLDLSKIEGGKMQIELTHGDIINYTESLINDFQSLCQQKNQTLLFHTALDTWETHFDKGKWNKIFFNLLSNAIKFTPENGKIEVSLTKEMKANNEFITLEVKDTGIGIAVDKQQNIFKRFYQADSSTTRIQDGTGIGLALVNELVKLQNGIINLESEINKGSEFTVSLPILEGKFKKEQYLKEPKIIPIIEDVSTSINAETDTILDQSDKLEILIIEDNAGMRNYIRSCINESIYNITEAENGLVGLQKTNEFVPDLIISDVMMPEKDGFEVVTTIRKQQSTSHIPIILLTAKSSLESKLIGLSRGADVYLTKPFSPQELTLRIQKLIEFRQLFQNKINNPNTESNEVIAELEKTYEKENSFIQSLRQYIEDNIDDYRLGNEVIAEHFSMSRMQLHRKMKALADTSISLFIKKIRLTKAIDLMKSQDMNISEIAYESGFSSPSQFSKTFRKETGKTPTQYLEDLRKGK